MKVELIAGVSLLLAVIMTPGWGQTIVAIDDEITLNEVLQLVDTERPDLGEVGAALQAGQIEAARDALIKHFAHRTQPVIPPSTFPGMAAGNSTTMPQKTTPEQAALWLKHEFTLSNNDTGKQETYQLGPQIDWLKSPSASISWLLYLCQMNHLNAMAGLYRENGDEALVTEIGETLVTWSRQAPRGFGYLKDGVIIVSPMEVRNRLCNLITTYDVVRASPSLTPEMHVAFWKIFITSARELMEYNGTSFPGLIPFAVMYPEFTESRQWLAAGEANLYFNLEDRTSPDGAWDTQSISYQTVPVPWASRTLEFLQANPGSGDYTAMTEMVQTQLGKLLSLMLWIAMPNGGIPNVGDTYGRSDWSDGLAARHLHHYAHLLFTPEDQARLQAVDNVYDRVKAGLALIAGESGDAPAQASVGFPASGYYVMRSSWESREARYLYLDLTPQALGHAHNDAGHIELYAYGKPLLADTGDYFLGWGYRAALHNTIEIDGLDQARGAKAPMMPHEWLTTGGFDWAEVAHGAYEEQGIRHNRQVLFIKPDYFILCDLLTGTGSHTYEQFFHFAGAAQNAAATARIADDTLIAASTNEGLANVQIIPASTAGLKASFAEAKETDMDPADKFTRDAMLGWMVTAGTFQRIKAPVVVYERQGEAPQAFYQVLFPQAAETEAEVTVRELPVTQNGQALAPTEAVGLVVSGEVNRPRFALDELQVDLGTNLALGKPAFAEINETSIAATSTLLTDGELGQRTLGTALSSEPYSPGLHLQGRFTVDFEAETEVNYVVLAHGTWNGSSIIYPAEKMEIQYWDGQQWVAAAQAQTQWTDDLNSQTSFETVRTTRLSVAVERPGGGRLSLREFEAYLIPEEARLEVAAKRAERIVEQFTDTVLLSHQGPAMRQYGEMAFDGEMAVIRRNEQGQITQISLKAGSQLSIDGQLALQLPHRQPYINLQLSGLTGTVECLSPTGVQLTVGGQAVALTPAAATVAPATAAEPVQISDARVVLEPPQKGFVGAQPSALITWRTSRPAVGQVRFGEQGRFDRRTVLNEELVTEHQARAWFLKPDEAYTFQISSQAPGSAEATVEWYGLVVQ